jgi:hypothetical protein
MARLAAANPFAQPGALKDWDETCDDALWESLRTQIARPDGDQAVPFASLPEPAPARRVRVKPLVVFALVGVAAAVVVFGLLFDTSTPPSAFAEWSPTTTSEPGSQLAAARSGCQQAWSQSIHLIPNVHGGLSDSLPPLVLTDSRGPFELLFFAGSSGESECLWKDGLIGVSGSDGLPGLPPPDSQSVGVPGVGFASDRGAPYTYAIGRAGSGVTGVTLDLVAHQERRRGGAGVNCDRDIP